MTVKARVGSKGKTRSAICPLFTTTLLLIVTYLVAAIVSTSFKVEG